MIAVRYRYASERYHKKLAEHGFRVIEVEGLCALPYSPNRSILAMEPALSGKRRIMKDEDNVGQYGSQLRVVP